MARFDHPPVTDTNSSVSAPPPSPSTVYARRGEFVTRAIAGEAIIVPVRHNKGDLESVYNLNEVAAFVWARIDGRATLGDVAAAVAAEFDVTPELAASDAAEFVAALLAAGIVEAIAPGGA
jgi:hypothetical protein